MAKKNGNTIKAELKHGVDQTDRDIMIDIVDSSVVINGGNSIATSDPAVEGQLFLTGSEAVGGAAGFNVICISEG